MSSNSNLDNWELSLKPVTERRVPSFERLLDRARALTAARVNWEPGKTVGSIQTFSLKPLEGKGPRWWARVSEHGPRHGKSAFDLMYNMFTKDRFENEKEYNKELNSVQYLKDCQWGQVWSLHYIFPTPLSPRSSTILTVTHLEGVTPRVFWVIGLPFQVDRNDIALSLFVQAGVTLNVCSVERIRELEGGKVEWLAASIRSPGGSIPLWLSEYYAFKHSTALVPKVDEYLDKPPKERSSKGGASSSRNPVTTTAGEPSGSGAGGDSTIQTTATYSPTTASAPPPRKDTGTSTQEEEEEEEETQVQIPAAAAAVGAGVTGTESETNTTTTNTSVPNSPTESSSSPPT